VTNGFGIFQQLTISPKARREVPIRMRARTVLLWDRAKISEFTKRSSSVCDETSRVVDATTVVGSDEDSLFLKRAENAVMCIGDNTLRRKVYEKLSVEYPNLGFPVIVHPSKVQSARWIRSSPRDMLPPLGLAPDSDEDNRMDSVRI